MNETIALVDPMPSMLILMRNCLIRDGYREIGTFYNANEFLDAACNGYNPSLVISEYLLPDMKGNHMLEMAKKYNPGLRAILATMQPVTAINNSTHVPVVEKGSGDFHVRLLDMINRELKGVNTEVAHAAVF
ncbi:MAG: response regulator [Chitinivibrionales bacterium]|nr:response regulator [Chitinivibrionales bacterium]